MQSNSSTDYTPYTSLSSSMDAYGCEAPQFLDFQRLHEPEDKERIEEFFVRETNESSTYSHTTESEDYEQEVVELSDNEAESESGEIHYYTPQLTEHYTEPIMPDKRLSRSMVCLSEKLCFDDSNKENEINKISEGIESLEITNQNKAAMGTNSTKMAPKSNKTATLRRGRCNSDTRVPPARSQSGSRIDECLNGLSKPKPAQTQFVSMQEHVKRFERNTPHRFHSKPKGTVCSVEKNSYTKACTVPQSPALATKGRRRPVTALTTAELEYKQFEEAKKFKIRAKPASKKILGPVKPIQPVRKSPTAVVPFKITEVQKKVVEAAPPAKHEFHARPAPPAPAPAALKRSDSTHKICAKTAGAANKHQSRKPAEPVAEKKPKWTGETTIPEPFSFHQKDKEILKRQEAARERFFEAERRAREFHSKPMPVHIYKQPSLKVKLNKKAESIESLKALKHEDEPKPFKARPPISLMKEPFEPKKSERPLIEVTQFTLSTENRARERQEYDEKRRLKELQMEEERKRHEEEIRLQELAEIQRQRKQTIHTAMPIKKFKEVPAVDPRPVTVPMTPHLVSRYKNKENLAQSMDTTFEE